MRRARNSEIDLELEAINDEVAQFKEGISGIISAPTEWLRKNHHLIDEDNSRVEVDREGGEIHMILNERNAMDAIVDFNELGKIIVNRSTVTGRIQLTDTFKKLRINTDEFWSTKKLAKFLRLNRSIFAKKDEGMLLVSQLKNVQAKITGDYEKKTSSTGRFRCSCSRQRSMTRWKARETS